jgi:OOP family OmpA-OmpF porin
MRFLFLFWTILLSTFVNDLYSQNATIYKINRHESVYIPLGEISFADSIVAFNIGKPVPFKKYSDSSQALNAPNYISYDVPNYVSLGCKGNLTVAFTDNGFMNLKGNDLYIFEVGPSKEAAKIEISENGDDWIFAGNITGGKSIIDLEDQNISSEKVFYFVKITDQKKVCNSKTAGADIDAVGAINCVIKITFNTELLFDFDKYELKPSADIILQKLSETIQKVKNATILIEGHTDSDGKGAYNLTLSQKRCLSVEKELKFLLGEKATYDYKLASYGENNPKVANNTKENKQLNRRVEITILPPQSYYKSINN